MAGPVYADSMSDDRPVTQILKAIECGDAEASDRLLPLVYAELRRLAAQKMSLEKQRQTLQPTALVHEAYLRLVDAREQQKWDSRGHFFAAAAEAMRRILVERARKRQAKKYGGGRQRVSLDDVDVSDDSRGDELLAINEALDELQQNDATSAELVKLRFFAGCGHQEAAGMLGITRREADRLWATARAWMFARLED